MSVQTDSASPPAWGYAALVLEVVGTAALIMVVAAILSAAILQFVPRPDVPDSGVIAAQNRMRDHREQYDRNVYAVVALVTLGTVVTAAAAPVRRNPVQLSVAFALVGVAASVIGAVVAGGRDNPLPLLAFGIGALLIAVLLKRERRWERLYFSAIVSIGLLVVGAFLFIDVR